MIEAGAPKKPQKILSSSFPPQALVGGICSTSWAMRRICFGVVGLCWTVMVGARDKEQDRKGGLNSNHIHFLFCFLCVGWSSSCCINQTSYVWTPLILLGWDREGICVWKESYHRCFLTNKASTAKLNYNLYKNFAAASTIFLTQSLIAASFQVNFLYKNGQTWC